MTVLKNKVDEQVGSSESEVLSATVSTGSISTTVSGSGTLADEDVESIEVPSSLEILDFYVEEGDTVEEGDLIATVTNASLLTALSEAQDALDTVDEELAEAASDSVSSTISASVAGRVKYIAVEAGDDVTTVMYESGSLMLLSLDGYMAVDVETDSLSVNDAVTVITSDSDEYSGTVESVIDGTATVIITDSGTTYNDEVSVVDENGNEIGGGSLYIHSQMAITGYAGTVSSISVSENESVSADDTLITLTDTETSANYDAILKSREDLEEQLETLIRIYKEGGIYATAAGSVSSLSSAASSDAYAMTDSSTSSSDTTTVAEISLDENMTITISVDESDILSLSEGQSAAVTIDSIGEDSFDGTVTEISTSATSGSGVTTYSAIITIEKTESMLSGMSASVTITIEGVDDALLIPVDALHQSSSTAYVYTSYDEESGEFGDMVEVTTGLSNSSYVEITDGLSEGDTVYYTESSSDSSSFGFSMDMGSMDMGSVDSQMSVGGGNSGGGDMGGGNAGGGSMPGGM